MTDTRSYYRRNLPHYQPADGAIFVTFRLADSLPEHVRRQLVAERNRRISELNTTLPESEYRRQAYRLEKQAFGQYDAWLDRCNSGPRWLAVDSAAEIVARELHVLDGDRYHLLVFCIMPNHVHLLVDISGIEDLSRSRGTGKTAYYPLTDALRLIKGRTARYCNQALGRSGTFWHHESYDHVVRNADEMERIGRYIMNNPVKAGLVDDWQTWPYSYVVSRHKDGGGKS